MKVKLAGPPIATFTLAQEEVAVLFKSSTGHDDRLCRQASASGGLIARWHETTTAPDPLFGHEISCSARELGLALKCLENNYANISDGEQSTLESLRRNLSQIFNKMFEMSSTWRLQFSTTPAKVAGWTEP